MSFKTDYSKIANLKDNIYIKPDFLEEILEDSTKMSTTDLNNYINSLSIKVMPHEIEKYLEEKLRKENRDAYNSKHILFSTSNITSDDNNTTNKVMTKMELEKYNFHSKAFSMFKFDISTARNRLFSLLLLIEKISNKKLARVDQNLVDLDIELDGNGDIKVADIKRIITPFIYLLNYLVRKTTVANDLDSYFDFKGPEYYDWYESQMNQTCLLQLKAIGTQNIEGYIPLTYKQIKEITTKQKENFSKSIREWVKTTSFFISDEDDEIAKRLEEIAVELDKVEKELQEASNKCNIHLFSVFNIKKGALEAEQEELLSKLEQSYSYSLK